MGKRIGRIKKHFIPILVMLFLVTAVGLLVADQSKVVMVGGGQAYKALDDFLLQGEIIGGVAGESWYVDSTKSASGDGKSWDYAVVTLNEAIDLAAADSGDVIHVAPLHAETITGATIVIPDVDGLTVIGYGEGAQRPTFSWLTGTGATFPVSGADFVLRNMIFDGSSDVATVAMFTVTAAGFQLIGCEIVTGDAGDQATLVITGSADADRMKVLGCHFTGSTDTGSVAAISFSAGATDIEIAYCNFKGDYSSAAIYSAAAILEVNIHHNYIYNFNNSNHAVEISSNSATGVIAYNHLVTDVYGTGLDSGGLDVIETYWSDDEVDDVMATPIFTHEDGAVVWSATERAILESEANDALVDEDLDHFVKATAGGSTTAYPSNVTDYSILAYIMAQDGAVSDYDEDTDSLEALGIQVADTNLVAQANVALVDENLDHFVKVLAGGSTTAYPSDVTDYSILAYIMAQDGAVADYDEDTDSLEAISDKITEGTDTLSGIQMDHFVYATAGGSTTAYPSDVTNYSILGYILGIDGDVTGFDEDTDSLEAIGHQVSDTNLELMANNALVDEGLDLMITVAASGSTTAYPENVVQYSVFGYVLGKDGDATGYDEDTDSLEALGDEVEDGQYFVRVASGGSTTGYPENVTQYSQLSYILAVDADATDFDEATDSLEAISDLVVANYTKSGTYIAVVASVESDAIPANTQSSAEITGAASGQLVLVDVYINCDSTGWANPTNIEITSDNTNGLTGAAAPIILEQIATFGANLSFVASTDGDTAVIPYLLENGSLLYLHSDTGAGTGNGKCDVTMVFQRVDDGATIAAADLLNP